MSCFFAAISGSGPATVAALGLIMIPALKKAGYSPAFACALMAAGGAIGMGMAISKSAEGIARQPEAEGKIRTTMMLGLVFLETAIIYALLVVILIIFVL